MSAYTRLSQGDGSYTQEIGDGATVKGYRTNGLKLTCFWIISTLFCGIPYLVARWLVEWRLKLTCVPSDLRSSDIVVITEEGGDATVCDVKVESISFLPDEFATSRNGVQRQNSRTRLCDAENGDSVIKYFEFQHEKYIWDDKKDAFRKIEGLVDINCQQIVDEFRGLGAHRRTQLRQIYGFNEIYVEVKGYLKLLVDEVLNPFYIFQVFSIILWSADEYYYYGACVVFISAGSIVITLYKTREQAQTLQEMAMKGTDLLVCIRNPNNEEEEINCRDLVPGDILLIPPEGLTMPCDVVLTQGNCIVNESMLTGESIPVNKSALVSSEELFNCDIHKKHVVFCGTEVIQPRFYAGNKVSSVVVRTGFATQKGQLIRSILHPKDVAFKFYSDALKFVFLLFCMAAVGMVYCIWLYVDRGATWYIVLVRVLDIVTIVVPPALPAAMTVGTLNAQSRLKKKKIYCVSPTRINFCGKLNVVCFDKTGTLTEEGLNLLCVVGVNEVEEEDEREFLEPVYNPEQLPIASQLLRGMATCHSLTYVKGNIVGDPLDLKMFAGTGWNLEEPNTGAETSRFDLLTPSVVTSGDVQLGIIREFDFTPHLQRMSVVTNSINREMVAYCKGAPEKIRPLCKSVPDNYDKVLDSFTMKGFRVLALGFKRVERMSWHKLQKVKRDVIESDLTFVGFLIMQNSLKPATIPVIKDLNSAKIRCVMVTGDNMLTALSVARECCMIPSQDNVIIVEAFEDGTVEYKMAATHYEAIEEDEAPGASNTAIINNNGDLVRTPGDGEEEQVPLVEYQPVTATRRLSKRFSIDSNAEDTVIDMEKLIPITDVVHDVLEGSNYHFAMTGKSWTCLRENCSRTELQRILAKGAIFARMSPDCKQQLVESLQEIDYTVGMCGDGANDICALTQAHVGISLSEAEASIAAPFTSKIADISCVPKVILEGRCALATSFSIFKYMALYSMVQFASVLILYTNLTNLADLQFLWIDLVITCTVTIVMGRIQPVTTLVSKRPMASLVSFSNVFSILSQILVCVAVQFGALMMLKSQRWFVPVQPTTGDDLETLCWESTTIFSVSSFQYLIVAVIYSKGPPFRKSFYTNVEFLLSCIVLTGCTAFLLVYPIGFVGRWFDLEMPTLETQSFRFILIMFPAINLVASFIFENFVSGSKIVKRLGKLIWKQEPKSQYKLLLNEIENDKYWPPVKT
ncbi:putative cation-transporting ATPase 13A3 [Orchesella cincta]|uniref:Cation-transporting ATPase n=1 Tax=Orchesella cincta TaxID=48709 RepID=A0A1D2NBQ7_ORCCI|nr:putative cation-transporting ATPase 13A3 [Orchesella cincta]